MTTSDDVIVFDEEYTYAARYQELKPGFMKAEELIREIATALDSTAKIVEDTDASIASQFRA